MLHSLNDCRQKSYNSAVYWKMWLFTALIIQFISLKIKMQPRRTILVTLTPFNNSAFNFGSCGNLHSIHPLFWAARLHFKHISIVLEITIAGERIARSFVWFSGATVCPIRPRRNSCTDVYCHHETAHSRTRDRQPRTQEYAQTRTQARTHWGQQKWEPMTRSEGLNDPNRGHPRSCGLRLHFLKKQK
jgi:hypothetical protein